MKWVLILSHIFGTISVPGITTEIECFYLAAKIKDDWPNTSMKAMCYKYPADAEASKTK